MVAFNQIGTNLRVPFTYVEFDNSNAQQGPSVMPFTTLIIGQHATGVTADVLTPYSVTSEAQAITLFGAGSLLHKMIAKYLENDKVTEIKAITMLDGSGSVVATGKVSFGAANTATEDGVVYLYVGGKLITVAVASGDDQDAVALSTVAAINADTGLPVTAAVNGVNAYEVDLTCKANGEYGNEIDLRVNYLDSQSLPAGMPVTITAMASGAVNPDLSALIAILPETQFNVIANPYKDATSLTALETELADRFGPIRQNDGMLASASVDSLGNQQALGNSRNSPHSSIVSVGSGSPTPAYEVAAAYGAILAKYGQVDPARPFQTLQMFGVLPAPDSEQFIFSERNILLFDGIATAKVADGGVVRVERAITTFQTNAAGAPDSSYLDVNTLMTLSFLRYDFRVQMQSKFPRSKLANDGTNFGPGQPVVTPLTGRAVAVEIFKAWELLGLVEGLDQFKRDLIVERNDFLLPPDLINQLRVSAAQIQFLL